MAENNTKEMYEVIAQETEALTRLVAGKIDALEYAINKRFDALKKAIGEYLELGAGMAINTVKANLKNV